MKICKHAVIESSWIISTKEGKYQEYDIKNGIAKSSLGIWSKPWPGPICSRFEDIDSQFKKRGGFMFCDEGRYTQCEFYETEENSKKIKINKRNPIDSKLRHEVFKRDNYKCVECGATNKEKTFHIDHILPFSRGGVDELDNLQTLCDDCNIKKSNKHWKGGNNGLSKNSNMQEL